MRPRRTMRNTRSARAAAGALMLAVPASAVALTVGPASAQDSLQIDVSNKHVSYDELVRVHGDAPADTAGHTVLLQYARPGATTWQSLSSTRIGDDGSFEFAQPLRRSGLLRAVATNDAGAASLASVVNASLFSDATTVVVSAKFKVARRQIDALGDHSFHVRGKLLPGQRGRRVELEARSHRRWHVIGSERTGVHGGFDIRANAGIAAAVAGGRAIRVTFAGDLSNTGASRSAGRVISFSESVASWYNDAGSTACGFHAGLGVANKELPCGTTVTFRYGGSTVTAVVDDRGPYVDGRTWDLNQSTAAALGFGGVGTVWTTS